ncbi:MAG: 4Fe-4S dicluster domain-containing protein [Nitrospirota bacterium]
MLGSRFVIDTSRCIGCKACQIACQQWHGLTAEDTAFTGSYQNPPDMSGTNLTVVKFTEKEESGKVKWLFMKDQCRHCVGAPCRSCPLGAIKIYKSQIVLIDPAICDPTACAAIDDPKPCQLTCTYNIPKWKYVKNGSEVRAKMMKCDLCYNRFVHPDLPAASKRPACMDTCPPNIMKLGAADTMLTKAINRAKFLRPRGYPKATVYPKQDTVNGPTRVIWVLLDEAAAYGLPGVGY